MKGVLVKKGNRVIGVKVGNVVLEGGQDERGIYVEATCAKCGKEFRSYLGSKGPIRSICDECRTRKGHARLEDNVLVVGRSRVKVKVKNPE